MPSSEIFSLEQFVSIQEGKQESVQPLVDELSVTTLSRVYIEGVKTLGAGDWTIFREEKFSSFIEELSLPTVRNYTDKIVDLNARI